MDHLFNVFLFLFFSAMQQILDNLKDLPLGTGAKDIDLIFLRGVMESPIVQSLAKVINYYSWCTQHGNKYFSVRVNHWVISKNKTTKFNIQNLLVVRFCRKLMVIFAQSR